MQQTTPTHPGTAQGAPPLPVHPSNPFAAPPPAYPQSSTKSEFDSDGIEFLRPVTDKDDPKPTEWLQERSAYPIDNKGPTAVPPQTTSVDRYRPPSSARVSYIPPGPPPLQPTPAPSQQMWAPPQHGHYDTEQGQRQYQEPEIAPRRFGPAFMYGRDGGQRPGGRLSKGLKIFSGSIACRTSGSPETHLAISAVHICLVFVVITLAFGAGFQSGRQVGCARSYQADRDNITMSEVSQLETHDVDLNDLDDDAVIGANRMLTG